MHFEQSLSETEQTPPLSLSEIGKRLRVGDIVFIRSRAYPFRKVAEATNSWTNHVGVVVDVNGSEPMIAESTFPFSKATRLSRFIAKSAKREICIKRLKKPLNAQERAKVREAAQKRFHIFYDTGFNFHSRGQFCSRFVYEVLLEATATAVGETEDLAALLKRNPKAGLGFWKFWYFGRIPWHRKTITPASLLESPLLFPVLEGRAAKKPFLQGVLTNFRH